MPLDFITLEFYLSKPLQSLCNDRHLMIAFRHEVVLSGVSSRFSTLKVALRVTWASEYFFAKYMLSGVNKTVIAKPANRGRQLISFSKKAIEIIKLNRVSGKILL
jgi:hypothetical protein